MEDQAEELRLKNLQAPCPPTHNNPKNPNTPEFPGGADIDRAVRHRAGPALNNLLVFKERPFFYGVEVHQVIQFLSGRADPVRGGRWANLGK